MIQFSLVTMLELVDAKVITLERLVELMCHQPARLFGVQQRGFLRKGEPEQVIRVFRDEMDANLVYVDAVDRFLDKLAGVSEPERKRKIIGAEFIRVFEEEARKLDGIEFLAQGTIFRAHLGFRSFPVPLHRCR